MSVPFYSIPIGDHFLYQGKEWIAVPQTVDGERSFNATSTDGQETKFLCLQQVEPK